MEPIAVADGVTVPAGAVSFRAVRASGPGGQNVNKVASKVELRVDLSLVEGLSPGARERLRTVAAPRLDAEGRLVVTSQRTRDQHRNLEDAREKVRQILGRLREKKSRAARKRARAASGREED